MAYFGFSRDYRTKCHVIRIMLLVVCSSHCYCQMNGFRVESSVDGVALSTSVDSVGRQSVVGGSDVVVRIFSTDPLPVGSQLSFTTASALQDADCTDLRSSAIFDLVFGNGQDESSAKATVRLATDPAVYMFCIRRWQNSSSSWRHQGNSSWLQLAVTSSVSSPSTLPLWAHIVIILALVAVSSLCTGLAVVVLSVSRADLKILRSCGVSEERRFVKAVASLRKKANRVICGLLFAAIFANAAIAVLIEDLMNIPGAAMIITAIVVMLFCIILPMIISSKVSLDFAAKSAWLANVVVVVTFFVSYPFGQLFDWIMSDDLPCVVDRSRLQCLQQSSVQANVASKDDDKDDARGGSGGAFKNLALSTKCVRDLMIPMSGVFMVDYNDVLDERVLGGILASGFTRIPVYEKDPANIVAVLHVRDLAYVHASDRTLLRTLCKFYNHPVNFVFEDTKLDVMLEEFKKGQSHMAFVQRVNCEGAGDPFYETLGMITLEDVIEGIFESEAIVEIPPDLIRDNSHNTAAQKAVKTENSKTSDFTRLKHQLGGSLGISFTKELSTQLESVVCQFLSTLRPFREEVMSQNIISRMLKQNVVLKVDIESSTPAQRQLYECGTPSDCFTLIVEGRAKIRVGQDGFVFDGGPFMYFGLGALLPEIETDGRSSEPSGQHSKVMAKQRDTPVNDTHRVQYVPDYTVECSTNALLVRVTAAQYRLALRAAALEFHIQTTQEVTSEMDIFAMVADGNNGVSSCGGGTSDAGADHDYNAMDDGESFASAKSRSQLLERRARVDNEC